MSYVVAGAILFLVGLLGITSFKLILEIREKDSLEQSNVELAAPASALTVLFKRISIKEKIVVLIVAGISAIITFILCNASVDIVVMIRYISLLIFLSVIAIVDGYTHLIPNLYVFSMFGMGAISLLIEFFIYGKGAFTYLAQSLVGIICCLVLFYVLSRLTKDGMGMGDIKVIAAMGWLIGVENTIVAVMFALIICTVVSVILLCGKKKNKNDFIPFGPFLFLGYILMIIICV